MRKCDNYSEIPCIFVHEGTYAWGNLIFHDLFPRGPAIDNELPGRCIP